MGLVDSVDIDDCPEDEGINTEGVVDDEDEDEATATPEIEDEDPAVAPSTIEDEEVLGLASNEDVDGIEIGESVSVVASNPDAEVSELLGRDSHDSISDGIDELLVLAFKEEPVGPLDKIGAGGTVVVIDDDEDEDVDGAGTDVDGDEDDKDPL